MRFCDVCGTYLRATKDGLWCPKCKKLIEPERVVPPRIVRRRDSTPIHIIDKSRVEPVRVSRTCPRCGNRDAFRWFSRVSGEHAGIRRERTIEHFKCTKCLHTWSKTS